MMDIAGCPAEVRLLAGHELRALYRVHHYASLFPTLKGEQRQTLKVSIRDGFDRGQPIIVWAETGEVVDGRNRRDVALELGLTDVPVAFVSFPDEEAVRRFVIQTNLARRHLRMDERSKIGAQLVVNGDASVRQAAATTGASKSAIQREAAKARNGAVPDGTVDPPPKPDPRIARVRKALDLLAGLAGGPIPVAIEDALRDDELAVLVALLDALRETPVRETAA